MFTSEQLKGVISEQKEIFLKIDNPIAREVIQEKNFIKICGLKEAVIITGVRRSGKSYLMRLIWQKIKREQKIGDDNFLSINFEDEKLLGFKAADFGLLLESYESLAEIDKSQKIYLFLDEIQNVAGWEKFLNRLLETGKYKIFVTGSNSSLLSKEISSALTGRNYPLNLYPLSFKEFVNYRLGGSIEEREIFKTETRIKIKKLFEEYQANGGFPEIVQQGFRPLLQEYWKNIIYRDIVSRYHIRNEASLRELAAFLLANMGVILSLEQISKMTKIKNLMTVKNYLSYLENSFLLYKVPKYSYSVKKQIYNPDKVYLVDTGLYYETAFVNSANQGRVLENLVFLELKRRGKNIFYYSEKQECDFLLQEKNRANGAIQVTKALLPENQEREFAGLLSAMKEYHLRSGLILVEEEINQTKTPKSIKVEPIWHWCLFS